MKCVMMVPAGRRNPFRRERKRKDDDDDDEDYDDDDRNDKSLVPGGSEHLVFASSGKAPVVCLGSGVFQFAGLDLEIMPSDS